MIKLKRLETYDGCITNISDGIATMTLENGAVKVECPEDFALLEYATIL